MMRVSRKSMLIIFLLACGIGCFLATPAAQADILQATLVEDTYVRSNSPDTNFDGDSEEIWIRNHNTVSRLGLFQFTLPQLTAGLTANDVVKAELVGFTVPGKNASSPSGLIVSGLSINPDLQTITYNGAVSQDIITGKDANYNFVYGANATVFSDIWSVAATSEQTYEATAPGEGLLKFVRDHISDTQPVMVTIAVGPNGTVATTDFHFCSQEYSGTPAQLPMSLTLTTVPEPSTALLAVFGVLLGLVAIVRRRR